MFNFQTTNWIGYYMVIKQKYFPQEDREMLRYISSLTPCQSNKNPKEESPV